MSAIPPQLSGLRMHSHTRRLSKCQLHYAERLNYTESSALLKSTAPVLAPYLPRDSPDQPACFSASPDKPVELLVAVLQLSHYFYYWPPNSTG